jgi:hypothetical protein
VPNYFSGLEGPGERSVRKETSSKARLGDSPRPPRLHRQDHRQRFSPWPAPRCQPGSVTAPRRGSFGSPGGVHLTYAGQHGHPRPGGDSPRSSLLARRPCRRFGTPRGLPPAKPPVPAGRSCRRLERLRLLLTLHSLTTRLARMATAAEMLAGA